MSERFDALAVRESNGKSYFTKIGAAFPNRNGGYSVVLDAIPAPNEGQFKILLVVPKPREDGGQRQQSRQAAPAFDDDVPY